MRLLICIDDTDSKTSEKGTGAIAEDIRDMVVETFDAPVSFISRHQLLIHPDVPYTSHNSSMCFGTEIPEDRYDELVERTLEVVSTESDPESDPGVAIADLDAIDTEAAIAYGKACKRILMHKTDAYAIAEQAGFFLKELGGTGDGIIGAAAGIGLRAWGYDGTMKGKPKDIEGKKTYTAEELLKTKYIERVVDTDGNDLPGDTKITVRKKPKLSVYGGELVLLAEPNDDGIWTQPEKEHLKNFGGELIFREGCEHFKPDVEEEQTGEGGCYDCLYRRWIETGILCQREEK
ncbi:MAG: hypothetical protein J6O85_01680 [Clostridia bacterium]|nr:hypothetical protein [Clostridia bacterium]